MIIWLLANGKRYAYYRLPAHEVFFSSDIDRQGHLCGRVQTITLKWPGKSLDVARDKRDFLPAEIRVKIWFGLAVHEQDWLSQQKGADLVIYAETYENQTNVLGQWITTGPLMTRPAWSDVTGHVIPPSRHSFDFVLSSDVFTESEFSNSSRLAMGRRLVHQSRDKVCCSSSASTRVASRRVLVLDMRMMLDIGSSPKKSSNINID